jgi:hypothetical protein
LRWSRPCAEGNYACRRAKAAEGRRTPGRWRVNRAYSNRVKRFGASPLALFLQSTIDPLQKCRVLNLMRQSLPIINVEEPIWSGLGVWPAGIRRRPEDHAGRGTRCSANSGKIFQLSFPRLPMLLESHESSRLLLSNSLPSGCDLL